MKNFLSGAKIILLSLILGLGISYTFAQWSGPSGNPPNNNTPPPVNVGSVSQTKDGSFWANFVGSLTGLFVNGNVEVGGLIKIIGGSPDAGDVLTSTDNQGNAIWGPVTLACEKRQTQTVSAGGGGAPFVNRLESECLSGEVRTGGGGNCGSGTTVSSSPTGTDKWEIGCNVSQGVTITSHSVCCTIQ